MSFSDKMEDTKAKSNPAQRIIIAVAIPVVIVLLGWGLMSWLNSSDGPIYALSSGDFTPTDLDETWWGWLIVVLGIAAFEYFWLGGPKTK